MPDARRHASHEARIKRVLRRTWHPFFARFGRLTQTQIDAVEPVYRGRPVLLSAPTATGKTEAVAAPALERALECRSGPSTPTLLFVAPTRALCNDLTRRLAAPVRRSGLEVDLKTGDHPTISKSAPPHVLVTTPESLDSMLCRRTRFLRTLKTAVFDELHLMHGSARGDHLQCLSQRLRQVAEEVQLCATSATVPGTEAIAQTYLGDDATVVETRGGGRAIDTEYIPASDARGTEGLLRELYARERGSKILVFVNRRADVEWLSARLADLDALGHHGSLSREQRLRVEKRFLDAPSGICVATMTLEVGVDIGDIDRVVLIEPPPDVAAFGQRIGRANRRSGRIQVTMVHRDPGQLRRFEHMVLCAREGRLFDEQIAFRPSVAAQQAISLAFQNPKRWISARALHARIPARARGTCSTVDCQHVLEKLECEGWLYGDSLGRFSPDSAASDAFKFGTMHCNIAPDTSVEVVEETTRRSLGRVSPYYLDKEEMKFAFGGHRRQISRVRDQKVFVEQREGADEVFFTATSGPRLTYAYCQDLAEFIDVSPGQLSYVRRAPGVWLVWHFFGSLWAEVFAGVMQARGFDAGRLTPFSVMLTRASGGPPRDFHDAGSVSRDIEGAIRKRRKRLCQILQPGPFESFVPPDLNLQWLRDTVDVETFAGALAEREFVEVGACPPVR
ncbi:MAG: DEAD/DEAH box helicase [Myxococcota bacterium]